MTKITRKAASLLELKNYSTTAITEMLRLHAVVYATFAFRFFGKHLPARIIDCATIATRGRAKHEYIYFPFHCWSASNPLACVGQKVVSAAMVATA